MQMKILKNNLYEMQVGIVTVWFSYETPIAFKKGDNDVVLSENVWSRTTGQHLNYIKQNYDYIELPAEDFDSSIENLVDKL